MAETAKKQIIVYTDGGCSGNPGAGGWALVILQGQKESQKETLQSGGQQNTTNNRMELTAAIQALKTIKTQAQYKDCDICIFTDSQYLKNGITQWLANWKAKGWKTANKSPVKNQDLWQTLDTLNSELLPQWKWVKGHAGNKYNEICDSLCQKEIAKQKTI